MSLATMEPNPAWDAAAHADAVDVLAAHADQLRFLVWGGDWCPDCRARLPDFAAALEAAEIPEEHVEHFPVEKAEDGSKVGPGVEDYGVELIPTVVVERVDADGEPAEIARFVEDESVPIADYLASEIERALGEVAADG